MLAPFPKKRSGKEKGGRASQNKDSVYRIDQVIGWITDRNPAVAGAAPDCLGDLLEGLKLNLQGPCPPAPLPSSPSPEGARTGLSTR